MQNMQLMQLMQHMQHMQQSRCGHRTKAVLGHQGCHCPGVLHPVMVPLNHVIIGLLGCILCVHIGVEASSGTKIK